MSFISKLKSPLGIITLSIIFLIISVSVAFIINKKKCQSNQKLYPDCTLNPCGPICDTNHHYDCNSGTCKPCKSDDYTPCGHMLFNGKTCVNEKSFLNVNQPKLSCVLYPWSICDTNHH